MLAKTGAGLELERRRFAWSKTDDAGHVARQQVGGELDAVERAVDGAGERLREHRLADAGHVLDEQVALGQEHGEGGRDRLALARDDGLDVLHDARGERADLVDAHDAARAGAVGAVDPDRRLAHAGIAAWR